MAFCRLALVLALTAFAGLGAAALRENHYLQAVWLLVNLIVIYIIVWYKPDSIKAFFANLIEAAFKTIARFLNNL